MLSLVKVLGLSLVHVNVACIIDFIRYLSLVIRTWCKVYIMILMMILMMIFFKVSSISTMLKDGSNKMHILVIVLMFVNVTMFNFIMITGMVIAVSLTVVDAVLGLVHMNIEMLVVIVGVVSVHVSKLTTVECVVGLLVYGLLDHKVNRLVFLMIVAIMEGVLLVHFKCVTMVL